MAAKYDIPTVRPIDRALGAFPDAKRKQGYWAARCRSHEDKRASLSIREMADGKVTVKCFAGCSKDDALRAVGLTWRDLLPPTVNSRATSTSVARTETDSVVIQPPALVATPVLDGTEPIPASAPQPERVLSPIATIATIADAKGLPVEFLAAEGLEPRTGVEIVYRDATGRPAGRRVRERAGDRFGWRSDHPVIPYGLDTLDAARERGSLWVVPTELDVWHLRRVEQTGIAVTEPAALARLEAEHVDGIGELLVVAEPGEPGDRFRRSVAARAAALGYSETVLDVRFPDEVASVAELARRTADRDQFNQALDEATIAAAPVDLSVPALGRAPSAAVRPEPDDVTSPARDLRRYATIARLAEETGLSAEYLREQGVRSRYGVDIPYFDEQGNRIGTKTRTRLVAKEGSFWEAGKPLVPYGLEHLDEAKADGVLFVPEGESDVWTARYHGFAALGIPGASATRCIEARHLDGVAEVFAFVEPDTGGANFLPGLRERLAEIGYEGTLHAVRMPEATKDLSALHTASASREEFRERLVALLDTAEAVEVTPSVVERPVAVDDPRHEPASEVPTPPELAARATTAATGVGAAASAGPAPTDEQTNRRAGAAERPAPPASEKTAPKTDPATPRPDAPIRPDQWYESRADRTAERARAATTASRVRRALGRVAEAGRRRLGRIRESVRSRVIAALGAIDPDLAAERSTDAPAAERTRTSVPSRQAQAALRGTPKQVAWAESVRVELGRRLDEHLKPTLDHTRERAPRERVLRTRRHLHEWLGRKNESAWFIDNRALTGADLVARAASEDPTVAKRLSGIAELADAARESQQAERDRERREQLSTERDRLTRAVTAHLASARRNTLPVLHVHIDAVERAALDYLEREQRPAFYAAHRDRGAREVLASMRRSDREVRSAVERYRRAAADVDAHTVSPAVRSSARDELPRLRGDAERVALARRLRDEALERASAYLDAQYLAAPAEDRERVKDAGTKLIATLERESRAEAWIETRDLDGAALVERAARLRPDLRATVTAFRAPEARRAAPDQRHDRTRDRAPQGPRLAMGVS